MPNPFPDEHVTLNPGDKEWVHAWDSLKAEWGNDLYAQSTEYDAWQYMGTWWHSEEESFYHDFRHRGHPKTGYRENRSYKASPEFNAGKKLRAEGVWYLRARWAKKFEDGVFGPVIQSVVYRDRDDYVYLFGNERRYKEGVDFVQAEWGQFLLAGASEYCGPEDDTYTPQNPEAGNGGE